MTKNTNETFSKDDLLKRNEHDDFIITGIPRSATSLLTRLLSKPENTYCFNEVDWKFYKLVDFFKDVREKIRNDEPIPNKYDGYLPASGTYGKEVTDKEIDLSEDMRFGSKSTIPYLSQIEQIMKMGQVTAYELLDDRFKIVVIIRNPVYAIGSWNSKKSIGSPRHFIEADDSRWFNVNFLSSGQKEMQAQIWEHFAHFIWSLRGHWKIIRYETLVEEPEFVRRELERYLDLSIPRFSGLKNCNDDSRYKDIDKIREAVKMYCPSRKHFGYE